MTHHIRMVNACQAIVITRRHWLISLLFGPGDEFSAYSGGRGTWWRWSAKDTQVTLSPALCRKIEAKARHHAEQQAWRERGEALRRRA